MTAKVFILAGQSNMEGKAPNELFDSQAADPKTRDYFAHLRKDDQWIVRDDVFIKFLDRKGPLTIGYGSPGRTGVELDYRGDVVDAHDPEMPTRLAKQLTQIMRGAVAIGPLAARVTGPGAPGSAARPVVPHPAGTMTTRSTAAVHRACCFMPAGLSSRLHHDVHG